MSFTPSEVQQVWDKGAIVSNNDPNILRKDECTAWIKRDAYGNRQSQFGWEIDHIDGNANNNLLTNLRPLQWENDAAHLKGPLTCLIVSQGAKNVRQT